MHHRRRTLLWGLGAVALVPMAGCTSVPPQPSNADGTYCHRWGRGFRRKSICTPQPVPSDAVEAEAKRYEGEPGSLTLCVLRRNWGDANVLLPFTVDGQSEVATVPRSLVRIRLRPGTHRLTVHWEGQASDWIVNGAAGEVQFVELVGSGWAWGYSFSWVDVAADDVKSRARSAKLVADLDLQR